VAGAAGLLLLMAPVLLPIAALVASDGGPVLYAHRRVGRRGREFGCLKFRSMRTDADRALAALLERDPGARAEWEAARKLRRDPRVTRLGRALRATSLDELPQLLNVLRGEMSLVGPRPVLRDELDGFYAPAGAVEAYLSVRPGLTGAWQVSGRSDTGYAERVALDAAYARSPSLRTDIAILARTAGTVLRRHGAY
jgi:lipopolysaccharide/colanic/teichoic acid biosynthesis glycosyltransferase